MHCALFPQGPTQPPYVPWADLQAALERWRAEGRFEQAWFLLKPPGLRLRFHGRSLDARLEPLLVAWLEAAEARNAIRGFRFAPYEPETARLGGPAGLRLAHDLFDRDSRVALRYAALAPADRAALPPDLFSLAVCHDLFAQCVGDAAELWDLWQRLAGALGGPAALSPADAAQQARVAALLLEGAAEDRLPPALAALLADARAHNAAVAARLHAATVARRLAVGPRAWLATVTLFHWNRLTLTTAELGPLVAAVLAAFEGSGV